MNITIISSSTRQGRVSHRIALALERGIVRLGHEVQIIDLLALKLPQFTERFSHLDDQPDAWRDTLDLLLASDGMIFLTPEYNGSFSSALKNFIDVFAKQGFQGKPIAVATGSSGAMGGIRAAYQLQQVILSVSAYPQPQMLTVGKMQDRIDEKGEIIDEDFGVRLEKYLVAFLAFSAKFAQGE